MTRLSFSILALIMSVSFNHIAHAEKGGVMNDLNVQAITVKAKAEQEKETKDQDAYRDAAVMTTHIQEGAHDTQCKLLSVVGSQDSWSKDLYVRAVSDMGAGVLTESEPIYGSNMTALVVGANPTFQLREANRWWFDGNLTSSVEGLDKFTKAARLEGYYVHDLGGVHCQSSSRHLVRVAKVREAQRLRDISRKAAAKAEALEGKTEEVKETKAEEPKAEEPKAEPKTSPA